MVITGDAKLISTAYVKARSQMEATVKEDATGNFGKYATLASITKATTAIFGSNGLAIIQEGEVQDGGVTVATWLLHDTGSTIEFTPLTIPLTARTAHAVGSAMTYARRYQLLAVCGLAPDDDDGQAAQDSVQNAPKATQKARTPLASEKAQDTSTPALATTEQLATIGKLGVQVYGSEYNSTKLSQWKSKGSVSSLDQLLETEAAALIKSLNKKISDDTIEAAQAKAAQPLGAAIPV